jgi:hypothetical protein
MRVSRFSTAALLSVTSANHVLALNYTNASTSVIPSSTIVNGATVANPSAFATNLQVSVEGSLTTARYI